MLSWVESQNNASQYLATSQTFHWGFRDLVTMIFEVGFCYKDKLIWLKVYSGVVG